jgi:hypothetical protein
MPDLEIKRRAAVFGASKFELAIVRIIALMAIAALAPAVWPSFVSAAPSLSVIQSVATRRFSRLSPAFGHLYVLDIAYKAVYRFPLAQDGLPATQPDGVLYPQGAIYPEGVAVDKAGHVFVADPNGWGGAVAEFAAGATGPQQPMSVLNLSGGIPDRLNIDDAERLYVHYNANQDIAIFAKGAHGNDAPISIVPPYQRKYYSIDYLIARNGWLFVLNEALAIAVYHNPLGNPSQPNELLHADGGYEAFFDQTLALDKATDYLYLQFSVTDSRYWNKVNYGVRPISGTSAATDSLIFTGDCGSAGQSSIFGTVIVKKYLIVSCNNNGDVLVYRTDQFGRQRAPVEVVGQGNLFSPVEMAVGP